MYSSTVQKLASSEQASRVTNWRREKRWGMVGLMDRQLQETEGELQCHSGLPLMEEVLVPCWIQFYLPSWKDNPVMSG